MLNLLFLPEAWEDYVYWQTQDRKTLKRINLLIQDILRTPFEGVGKPEPLRENRSGWWSRRIDDANQIVYKEQGGAIIIAACKGHYEM